MKRFRVGLVLFSLSASLLAQVAPRFRTRLEPGFASRHVAAFDRDADGDVDLVIGTFSQGIQVLTNDGTGVFARSAIPSSVENALVAGDLDGDGDEDVVVTTGGDVLLLRNTAGTLVAEVVLPAFGPGFARLFDADVDGDLDLVTWGPLIQPLIHLNDGAGAFSASPALLPLPSVAAYDVRPADVDGDGREDLLVFAQLRGNLLLRNTGSGFVDASGPLAGVPRLVGALPLDADGDGHLDLLGRVRSAVGSSNSLAVLFGDGTGAFPRVAPLSVSFGNGPDWAAGDLDEDGDVDVVITSLSAVEPTVQILVNDGHGGFRDETAALGLSTRGNGYGVALADLDGDRDLDVYAAGSVIGFGAADDLLLVQRHVDLEVPLSVGLGASLAIGVARQPGNPAPGSLGLALIALGGERARGVATPFGSVWLLPDAVGLPVIALPGGEGVHFEAVPADPALVGLRVSVQALLLDVFGVVPPRLTARQRVTVR